MVNDYDEFYAHTNWQYPDVSKGVERVELYFRIAALYHKYLVNHSLHVLDVGCGTGFYTYCLGLAGFEADGLDCSEVAIQQAQIKWGDKHQFIHGDGRDLRAYAGQYDVIFARGLSLYNTCDAKAVGRLTNHYLSVLRPRGVVMVIISSDLTGTNPGWMNCTYAQMQTLFSQVCGHVVGPLFFDYWIVKAVLTLRGRAGARALMWSLRSRAGAELLALAARHMGARVPTLFLASHALEDL
jgi:SAM-dependent methyltransferase